MKGFRGHLAVTLTGGLEEAVTPWAGASLLVEAYGGYGVGAAAERALPQKRASKGLSQGQMVESFVLLSALGGEGIEDRERLREDKGLEAMVGYTLPAPETARQWLDRFHDEGLMVRPTWQGAFIPAETAPLAGLREPNRQVVWSYMEKVKPGWEVTLDGDAHLVETAKANARYCYEGYRLQPVEVAGAETGLVLAAFRDGNVPAGQGIKEIVDAAYDTLPPGPWRVKVRSDAAACQEVLDHWQGRGWEFAVSADMSPPLRQEIEALSPEAWPVGKTEKEGMIREWAEVPYVPTRHYEKKIASLTAIWPCGCAASKETVRTVPRCATLP